MHQTQKNLWWLYVALLLFVGYGRMAERLLRDAGGFWSQFGPPLGATLVAIGLACWLRNKGALAKWLWRFLHLILCIAQAAGLFFGSYLALLSVYRAAAIVLAATVLLIPALYALHMYAYRSDEIWSGTGKRVADALGQ